MDIRTELLIYVIEHNDVILPSSISKNDLKNVASMINVPQLIQNLENKQPVDLNYIESTNTILVEDLSKNFDMELKWPIPIEDFQIIVYESAILSTKYLQECIKDFMTCLLTTLREMFKISPEEHENIMTYLCMDSTIKINTSVDPKTHLSILKLFTKKAFDDLNTISFRLNLMLNQQMKPKDEENFSNFRRRQAGICCNGIIFLLRAGNVKEWVFKKEKYNHQQFEDLVVSYFNDFLDGKHFGIEELALHIFKTLGCQELYDPNTFVKDLKEHQKRKQDFFGVVLYPIPLKYYIYEVINEIYFSSYFDHEKESILPVIQHFRSIFKLSDVEISYMDIASFFSLSDQIGDIKEEEKYEAVLITQLQKLPRSNSEHSKNYLKKTIVNILKVLAHNFLNIFENYLDQCDKLKTHLSIYSLAIRILGSLNQKDLVEKDEINLECFKTIIIESVKRRYQELKELHNQDKIEHNLIHSFNYIKDEIDLSIRTIIPVFQPYYKQSKKKLILKYLEMISDDISNLSKRSEDYESILTLCSGLRDLIIKHNVEKEIWKRVDYHSIFEKPLKKWISNFKTRFSEYIIEIVKTEVLEPLKNEKHSGTPMNIYLFLKNAFQQVNRFILPGTTQIIEEFLEGSTEIVKTYILSVGDGLPDIKKYYPLLSGYQSNTPSKNPLDQLNKLGKVLLGEKKTSSSPQKQIQVKYQDKLTSDMVITLIYNLLYLQSKYKEVILDIERTFVDFQSSIPDLDNIEFDDYHKDLQSSLKSSIEKICNNLAARYIFIDLQSSLSKLYSPRVQYCTARSLIEPILDPFLVKIYQSKFYNLTIVENDNISSYLIQKSFQNLILYLSIIILDGENRTFIPKDSIEILYDIQALEDLFYDNGQVLKSIKFLLKCTNRLKCIVNTVMVQSTKTLIEGDGKDIQGWEKYPDNHSNSLWSKQIIYKVIHHRNDEDSKKFLQKKKYKYH